MSSNHNSEVSEYGLSIDDRDVMKAHCKRCSEDCLYFPGKDWIYCPKCYSGCSRLEMATEKWVKSRTASQQEVIDRYVLKFIKPAQRARSLWRSLEAGQELDNEFKSGSSVSRYLRLLSKDQELEELFDLSIGPLRIKSLPALALKLEDLPGRIGGLLILKGQEEPEIARFVPGPKISFLQERQDALVISPDPYLVLRSQAKHMSLASAPLPLAFADIGERPWQPPMGTDYLYSSKELGPHELNAVASSGCRVYLPDRYPLSQLGIMNASSFCIRAQERAVAWDIAASSFIAGKTAEEAALLMTQANLPASSFDKLTKRIPADLCQKIQTAIARRPLIYRVTEKKIVMDDGTSWLSATGSVILSCSLAILRLQMDSRGKAVYTCQVTTERTKFEFQAGKEFERDTFRVVLRECLLRGIPLTYDRAYGRVAFDIAVGLRPPQPSNPGDQ